MKNSSKKYMYFILAAIIVALLFFIGNQKNLTGKFKVEKSRSPILPKVEPSEPVLYDIDRIRPQRQAESRGEPADLEAVYKDYPEAQAGQNMVEGWAKVAPEDKDKIAKGISDTIKASEEALRINPDDRKVKSKLAISKMMKELVDNNFNYKFKDVESGGE